MINFKFKLSVSFVPLLLALNATAQSIGTFTTLPSCPETISTSQSLVSENNPDWSATRSPTLHRLRALSFYYGPVSEKAELKPKFYRKSKAVFVDEWTFNRTELQPIYMACSYGQTDIILSQAIPTEVKFCTLSYDGRNSTIIANSFVCRK